MLLRFYVRRAIPARGSSRSLEPLEFHISMRPTSPAAESVDPGTRAQGRSSVRYARRRGPGGGRRIRLRGRGGSLRGGERGADRGRGGGGGGGGSASPQGRGLQAADEPLCLPGPGGRGAAILGRSGARHGLPVVAEVLETSQLASMIDHVDVLQVGARNMQNFALLRALGKVRRPVLLKRGFSATVDEWLLAAEYLLDGGNDPGHPLRARHPHLRDGDAEHAGPRVGGAGEAAEPSARPGRSLTRHGAARAGHPDGAGGGGGRGGRAAGGGACAAGRGAVRRSAGADAGAVLGADAATSGGAARGGRTLHHRVSNAPAVRAVSP